MRRGELQCDWSGWANETENSMGDEETVVWENVLIIAMTPGERGLDAARRNYGSHVRN